MYRQLFNAMDRDPPHDEKISLDEFVFYYSAYEDYICDAFAGYCPKMPVKDVSARYAQAEWYYQNSEGDTEGPLDFEALKKQAAASVVLPSTCVWCEEIDVWIELAEVPGLMEMMS